MAKEILWNNNNEGIFLYKVINVLWSLCEPNKQIAFVVVVVVVVVHKTPVGKINAFGLVHKFIASHAIEIECDEFQCTMCATTARLQCCNAGLIDIWYLWHINSEARCLFYRHAIDIRINIIQCYTTIDKIEKPKNSIAYIFSYFVEFQEIRSKCNDNRHSHSDARRRILYWNLWRAQII